MGLKHHKLATLCQRVWTFVHPCTPCYVQRTCDGRICQTVARPIPDRSCLRYYYLQLDRDTVALLPDVRRDVDSPQASLSFGVQGQVLLLLQEASVLQE